ncbi:PilW family protein [Shewanella sp. NIFS-20-20]|uniref:PilW family protein n=1 Tax=Shewanella sp. NIFS-20-20 TaxID=2853806 RepID=UPI001C493D77|nr:PilW family protein [Shewanella sp. NIFS-20-20]MBV7314181.1 PilW family protein [Shewanella sp. NIFS-20-20]
MVTMLIALFLTLGLFTMFNMSSSNVTTTSQFNQLQENGRLAFALMEPDVSQLGFFADITGTEMIPNINTQILANPIAPANDCIGAGVNNATFPDAASGHFRRLWGYEQGGPDSLSCLAGANEVKDGTDVLQLKRLIGPDMAAPDDINRLYMGVTPNQAVIFSGDQITPGLFNARFWEYQHHVYYIRDDNNGVPVLRRKTLTKSGMTNDEQLVAGIEDMRILYGFDSNGDDSANSFMPAENVTSLMWDNELFQRLVAVRIFLLVRAIDQDITYTNDISYRLGDKVIPAPNDNFRRRIMATTIMLENPVLIRN